MKFLDILSMSFNSLTHRKLRSWLTVLGIVIGVAAVVGLVSVGQGLSASVQSQLGGLGANLISVTLGHSSAGGGFSFGGGGRQTISTANLTQSDIRTIHATPGIQYVDGTVSGRADVTYEGQTASLSVNGVDTSVWRFMQTTQLDSGRYLATGDEYVAVIGSGVASGLFKNNIQLNSPISIAGHSFRVVGILQSTGGGFGESGNTIYIPIENARQINITTDLTANQFSSISAQVFSTADVQTVVNELTSNLMLTRHVTNSTQDFTVTSALSLQQSISSVTGTITYFLAGIAGISLLVGGIGIANTMFMSVIERTRQIGVLKSLGMTNNEVMKQFLTESALLGLIGGIIGVVIGVILAYMISSIGGLGGGIVRAGGRASTSITVISPEVLVLAVGFSVFIGAISGLLPARRASKLQPVEALRYE